MTDDIVTHLRKQHELKKLAYPELCETTKTVYEEAADEIERLRAELNSLANAQDGWGRVPKLEAEVERLRKLGDALADTGGQHGFDKALDDWKDYRNG